ncbi:MAG: DUF4838 domain-containing protein [Abditibacteriota bacterium]|nr:DUF4838 domain-containing protein [Abditibacteriota bacterium]
MKTTVILIVLLMSLSLMTVYGDSWTNSLKPTGKSVTVDLVKGEKPLYTIVVPAETELNEEIASKDLSEFLGKIYNVDFEITEDTYPINGKFISLGNTKQFQKSKLKAPKLNGDGYAILTDKKGNIYILGGITCGALNGVYALLEEDLGCRFYTKLHDDVIPTAKNGKLSFVPRDYSPQFIYRYPHNPEYDDNRENAYQSLLTKDRPYIRRNRMHTWEPNGGCHTVFIFCPKENYEKHPEWFSEISGERVPHQVCWSNKEMLDLMTKNAVNEMRSYKKDTLCISPMDSYPCCDCAECRAFDAAHGNTKAASLINGMNHIAEAVSAEFPNATIQTLAYLDTITPPTNLPLHKNMQIILCSDCCDWEYPLCTYDETEKYQNLVKGWVKLAPKGVMTWNYIADYDHLLMPNPNMAVVDKNIKLLKDLGVTSVFLQGISGHTLSNDGYLKCWVWGKLLWDPSRDLKSLIKDFCYGYYGEEIGPIMYEYEMSLIEMYEKAHAIPHNPNEGSENVILDGLPVKNTPASENIGVVFDNGIRWTPDVKMYTDEWIENSFKLFDKALSLCKTEEERNKVRYARIPIIYLKLARNLGYLRIGGNYISKPPITEDQKKELMPLYEEINTLLDSYGVKLIGEIADMHNSKENLFKRWNRALNINMDKIGYEQLPKDDWAFKMDPNGVGYGEGWYKSDYDTSDWAKIKIGATWDEQGYGTYEGEAWYKKKINIIEDQLKANEIYLLFGPVDEEATVYVNGELVMEHTMAKLGINADAIYIKPFIVKVKKYLKVGENDITVEVGNTARAGGLYSPIGLSWTYKDVSDEDMLFLAN